MYSLRTSRKPAVVGNGGVKLARRSNRVANVLVHNTSGRSPITAPLAAPSPRKQSDTKGVATQPRYQVPKQDIGPEGDEALSEVVTRQEGDLFKALASKCNTGKPVEESQDENHVDASVGTSDPEARRMLSDPDALVDAPRRPPVPADPLVRIAALVQKDKAQKNAKVARAGSITRKAHGADNRQLDTLLVYLNHPARLKVKHLHQTPPSPEKLSAAKTSLDQGMLKLNPRGTEDASVATELLKSYVFNGGSKLIPISQQNIIAQAQLFWFTGVDKQSLPGVLALSTLDLMPEPQKSAFVKVLQHFARVANNSATNRTDARTLAFIYGKMLIADVKISPSEYKARLALAHSVMQCLIELHIAELSETSESQ